MSDIPHNVLSEHFQERMGGRRLIGAVFTAFQLDPGFFEREILPVFLDVNLSHAAVIKLVQLEDCLRSLPGGIAVYYDANGLVLTDDGAAKLDVRRVPVRMSSGVFHPKNVFALVEDIEAGDNGKHARTLLVASLSANLTRTGWWENVEVCHVEELGKGDLTCMREDLLAFFAILRQRSPAGCDHAPLDAIAAFVRQTEQRPQRKVNGRIQCHFFPGNRPFDEFLWDVFGADARELYLEVLSPYFDKDDESAPLEKLIKRFRPRSVRVLLPRNASGEAEVPPAMYDWLAEHELGEWGRLPPAMVRSGKGEEAKPRCVHAKVYRFFSSHPKRELLAIGSVNLTRPAHQQGGNLESALVLEIDPPRRPDFWLESDRSKPPAFVEPTYDEDGDPAVAESGSRLAVRFHWETGRADAFWESTRPAPHLELQANGVALFELDAVEARIWVELPADAAEKLRSILKSTSFLTVVGDRPEPVMILVLEEGMFKKPPLLSHLSVRDILLYWSLLTPEQRNEFIQVRAGELLGDAASNDLVSRLPKAEVADTIFDRFAGTFHAFECVARSVAAALEDDNEKEALYRIFGMKHDSLGSLLRRVSDDAERDAVEKYVIVMCARQLCRELRRRWPDLWSGHVEASAELEAAMKVGDKLRADLAAKDPGEMGPFLDWFDRWFIERAKPMTEAV